jgi:hypothetical protein
MSLAAPNGTVTAGTGITATTGNIAASSGNVTASALMSAGTTITAGTGITATTGNIVASTGNIISTAGSITASSGTGTFSALAVTGAITHTPIGARFGAATNQLILNNTETELTNAYWNTTALETYAAGCTMNTSGRIIFATGGTYLCTANLGFANNSSGTQRFFTIFKNGLNTTKYGFMLLSPTANASYGNVTAIITVTSSDYISMFVYQDSGGSLNTNFGSANQYSFFNVVKLC